MVPWFPAHLNPTASLLTVGATGWNQTVAVVSFEHSWPFYKMATSQSPSPGGCLILSNSPATAVCSVHCSFHLCVSLWRPLRLLVVTVQLQVQAISSHTVSLGSRRNTHSAISFFIEVSLLSLWSSVLPSDPSWVLGNLLSSFSSLGCYILISGAQILERFFFYCSPLHCLSKVYFLIPGLYDCSQKREIFHNFYKVIFGKYR